jgi:hypothetical protein
MILEDNNTDNSNPNCLQGSSDAHSGDGVMFTGSLCLGPTLSCCGQLKSLPEALRQNLSVTQVPSAGRSHLIVPGRAQHNLGFERLTLMPS